MSHTVREFVRQISLKDLDQYPEWDLSKPLPRLPVPDLRTTLNRYMGLVAPIVDDESLKSTRRLVDEFVRSGGEGEKLQSALQIYAKTQKNWATPWWLEDMYLKNPLPLPVNSNPGMVFPRHNFISTRQQLRFAAQLISGILDYKTILDTRSLPIDRVSHNRKGQPLCMEQYYRLFTSYRHPGVDKDSTVMRDISELAASAHAVVVCHDQFFKLELVCQDNKLSEEEIYNQLRRISSEASANKGKAQRIGALTALPRPRWAEVCNHLTKDPVNKTSVDIIEKGMFMICLDISPIPVIESMDDSVMDLNSNEPPNIEGDETEEENKVSDEPRNDEFLVQQMLHGQGSRLNGTNRWYDKTMQFIISRDGNCGLNYEHSVAEGIAVIRLIEYILKYMHEVKRWRFIRHASICSLPAPVKLEWKVDSYTEAAIVEAIEEIDHLVSNLDMKVLRLKQFGKDFPKTVNMSPDSFIQLAIQLTHFKFHGHLVATYESASTRRFLLGRVDNIRASSVPALKWCRAMTTEDERNKTDDCIRLLRQAMDWQTEVMLETILGYGVDNHLLGLQQIALAQGKPLPAIFTDPTYRKANWFRLGTSQTPTTMDTFMCYGAVVPNGYGVAYNPRVDCIVAVVTCWKDDPTTDAHRFAQLLHESLIEMHDLVLTNPELARQRSLEPTQWTIPEEISGCQD